MRITRQGHNAPTPRLLFSTLEAGDTVLSWHFDVWQGNSYLTHINAYHPAFAKYGPGTLHMDMLVFEALSRQASEFSFGRGDEPYKAMWPHEKTPLWRLRLFRNPWARLLWETDPWLKSKLKRKS